MYTKRYWNGCFSLNKYVRWVFFCFSSAKKLLHVQFQYFEWKSIKIVWQLVHKHEHTKNTKRSETTILLDKFRMAWNNRASGVRGLSVCFMWNVQKLITHPLEVQILIVISVIIGSLPSKFRREKEPEKMWPEKLLEFIQFMKYVTLLLLLLLLSDAFHVEILMRSRVKS